MFGFAMVFKHPIGSLAYFLLSLAILSLWCNRKIWIWGPLFILSYTCAYYGSIATIKALIPIGILLISILSLTQKMPPLVRLFILLFTIILSLALFTHFSLGFTNLEFVHHWQKSATSSPMNLYLNFDKGAAALLILAFLVPLIKTRKEWQILLFSAIPWALLSCCVLLGLAYLMQLIRFEPKIPTIALFWLLRQIFFVVIPEEALFRGLIQKELTKSFPHSAAAPLALIITSLIYATIHLLMIPSLSFFVITFAAAILYGSIYQMTNKIESAIFTHLMVNLIHFFFFTYPIAIAT